MNDEKELLENEVAEAAPEITEEVIEEAVPEVSEEAVEEVSDVTAEEVIENAEEVIEEVEAVIEKAEISKGAVAVISAAITFLVCIIIVGVLYFTTYNKYNANKDGYVSTLTEVAEMNEMSLEDFKAEWGLPSNMSGDTTVAVAQAYIPTGKFLEMSYGMTFEQFAQIAGITEEDGVDENSPWGLAQKIMNEKAEAEQKAAEGEAVEGEAAEGEAVEGEAAEGEAAEGAEAPAENAEAPAAE